MAKVNTIIVECSEIEPLIEFEKEKDTTFLQRFLGNFNSPIIMMLILALAINAVYAIMGKSQWFEVIGVAVAILIAMFISTLSVGNDEDFVTDLRDILIETTYKEF